MEFSLSRPCLVAHFHPQTIGKFERLDRTAEATLESVIYTSPEELQRALTHTQCWYDQKRCHKALGNPRPVVVHEGQVGQVLRTGDKSYNPTTKGPV